MTIRIPAEYDGRLLRSYLKLTLGLSTAVLSKLKNNERGILVNGERVTVRYVLREGDLLELADRDRAAGTAFTFSEQVKGFVGIGLPFFSVSTASNGVGDL